MAQHKPRAKNRFDGDLSLYRDLLDTLRFAISMKHGLLVVGKIRDVPDAVGDNVDPMTEVVIQIEIPNPKNSKTGSRTMPIEKYGEFFAAWPIQEAFFRWCGKSISESIPSNSPAAKYKRKLANIRVGRPAKLPPTFYLRPQYEQIKIQINASKIVLNNNPSLKAGDGFLKFAQENQFIWHSLIEKGELGISQILTSDTRSTAQYILSLLHHTSEEAVRSKLFRNV